MEGAELRIIFTDDATQPAAPPPTQIAPQEAGAPAPASSPQSTLPPGPAAIPVGQYAVPGAGAAASPVTPVGAAANPDAAPLSASHAKQLFEQFGLRPSQVGLNVAAGALAVRPTPQTDVSTGRLAVDAVHDVVDREALLRSISVTKPKDSAGPEVFDSPAGPVAKPPKPPAGKPSETVSGVFESAFGAAASQGIGAVAGQVGSLAGPGAGALAGSLGASAGALAATGPAAIAVGALAVSAGAAAAGLATLANESDKLKNLSPEVANARAFNDVREQFALMRRAESVGPQLGQFTRTSGDINIALTQQMTEVTKLLLALWQVAEKAGFVEFFKDAIRLGTAQAEQLTEIIELMLSIRDGDPWGVIKNRFELEGANGKVRDALLEFLRRSNNEDPKGEDPTIGMLERQLAAISGGLERGEAAAKVRKLARMADDHHGRPRR